LRTILLWGCWLLVVLAVGLSLNGQFALVKWVAVPAALVAAGTLSAVALLFMVGTALKKIRHAVRGYDITFQSRAGITYRDKRGIVTIDGEMLIGSDHTYAIWTSSMRLIKPGTCSEIDETWRTEIIERIERAIGSGKLEIA